MSQTQKIKNLGGRAAIPETRVFVLLLMPVIKIANRKRFTTVSNLLLNNEKLSLRAKGLMCYLLSKPVDWVVNVRHLCKTCSEGRDAIYKVIEELLNEGYMTREQSKENGKFTGYDYTVYEEPVPTIPLPEKPYTENTPILNTDVSKKESSKEATPVDPDKMIRDKKINFLKLIIDWISDNPSAYPKLMFVEFAKYWVESSIGKKKIQLRYEEQDFFDIGRRLSTWFKKVKQEDLNTYWEQEPKVGTVNDLFKKQILKINGTSTEK